MGPNFLKQMSQLSPNFIDKILQTANTCL